MKDALPKLSLCIPAKDADGRYTKSEFRTADCPSLDWADLEATLRYLVDRPDEVVKRIAGKKTR